MRARDFIIEAKPSNLGNGMLDKLFATYQKRDSKDRLLPTQFKSGLEVADYIYQYVGANYLIWASKQYNQDQHFFLHDLPAWKSTLENFAKTSRTRTSQIEKDINRYTDIDQLRQTLDQAAKSQEQSKGSQYDQIIKRLNQYVESKDAKWLYQGKTYSIYYPFIWEASRELGRACALDKKSGAACVTVSKNYFDEYTGGTNGEYGTLIYTIAQDKVYVAYLSNSIEYDDEDVPSSEFSDITNNHKYNLSYQLTYFPELKNIIKKFADPNDEDVQMQLVADSPEERYKLLLKLNKISYRNLPKEFQTYEISRPLILNNRITLNVIPRDNMTEAEYYDLCKIAVNNWGGHFKDVPADILTPELSEMAIRKGGSLFDIPVPLRTAELCQIAFKQNINNFSHIPKENMPKEEYVKICNEVYNRYYHQLEKIPQHWRKYELCRIAIEHSPASLRYVHQVDQHSNKLIMTKAEYIDLCKLAVQKDNKTIDLVPTNLRPAIKQELNL